MASYTKITNTDAIAILKIYGFETTEVSLTPLSDGISNSNYKVCFNDQVLLLKISNDKTSEQLSSEHKILNWLAAKNFKLVVAPLKTINEQTVYNYLGYTGALFPFIPSEPYQKNEQTMYKLGKALAELHLISVNEKNLNEEELRKYKTVGYGIKQILNYLDKSVCPPDFKKAFDTIYPDQKADQLLDLDLPGGIIHGDFYFDNALFFGSEIKAILDFEQAGIGRFILDLGIAISGSALEDNKMCPKYIQAYRKGYEDVRPLTIKESEFFNDAIIIGLFSISLWRIKRFTEGSIDTAKKDNYRELLDRALHFQQGL